MVYIGAILTTIHDRDDGGILTKKVYIGAILTIMDDGDDGGIRILNWCI